MTQGVPIIAGFDVATCTGFAWGDGSRLPTIGHWELPTSGDDNEDLAPFFQTFRDALTRLLRDLISQAGDPGLVTVLFEAPVFPKPFLKHGRIIQAASIRDRRKLYGLVSILEMTCADLGVRCFETSVTEVKKQLTGNGAADKADMVRAATRMGLQIAKHDEADAVGVWLVGVFHYARHHLAALDAKLYGHRGQLL